MFEKKTPITKGKVILLVVLISLTSCVNTKKYDKALQDKNRFETALNQSHRELRELRELRYSLEDQLRSKTNEVESLQKKLAESQKLQGSLESQNTALKEEQLILTARASKLRSELDSTVTNHSALMNLLQTELNALKTKKKAYRRRRR